MCTNFVQKMVKKLNTIKTTNQTTDDLEHNGEKLLVITTSVDNSMADKLAWKIQIPSSGSVFELD